VCLCDSRALFPVLNSLDCALAELARGGLTSRDEGCEVWAADSIKKAHAAIYIGWLVNGLPMKLRGSINSANARISAIVLADDMLSSRLLGSNCWICPSKECMSVGWWSSMIRV